MNPTHSVDVGYPRVEDAAVLLSDRWQHEIVGDWRGRNPIHHVYGIPRGGCVPAALVARHLGLPLTATPHPENTLVVDDLVDSGATLGKWNANGFRTDALFRKSHSPTHLAPQAMFITDEWLHFPWEIITAVEGPTDHVLRLLEYLGEDPTRPGLLDTPMRVVRSLVEMTSGRDTDIEEILSTTFEEQCDEMVLVRNVEFTSLCEHHLLPFTGSADVAYIPSDGKVVGLSKLARLVDAFAQRLQVQERMTREIADALVDHLDPLGVGVVVRAHHSCMGCRGVKKPSAEMVTSAVRGVMKDDPRARAEFLDLR